MTGKLLPLLWGCYGRTKNEKGRVLVDAAFTLLLAFRVLLKQCQYRLGQLICLSEHRGAGLLDNLRPGQL